MKILVVSGYPAWDKVSKGLMPSHHLFGVHELVHHYETVDGSIRGILKNDVLDGGYVDFYIWKSGKENIVKQVAELIKKSKEYDMIYDQLNRCSIFLGVFKKIGLLRCKLLTILHHPPYNIQLNIADSDAYIFFNEDYKAIAVQANSSKKDIYYVNEWYPDMKWYDEILDDGKFQTDAFYIDNGKSRRDRECLIKAAETAKIRVDYAGTENESEGYARAYSVDLKDDIGMVKRLRKYHAIIVPVLKNEKYKIGPLGITSFLDCVALEMPVIASDNVCFANNIVKNDIGIVYQTGNKKELSGALLKMENEAYYKKYSANIKKYRIGKTVQKYSENLLSIIKEIMEFV